MAEKLIVPFVHLNGTSADELLALRETAYAALDAALAALKQMAPNGRDYYPITGRMELAVEQHTRRMQTITDMMKDIEAECTHIGQHG